ncbi:MAG: sugar-binding transcriptional regulator, partial [Pseudomonadota bacterium]
MAIDAKTNPDVAARAAWLHFVGGLTQGEVARHLNVTNTRAHRLIARAQADGLVQIFVDVEATECVMLERQLMERFGL